MKLVTVKPAFFYAIFASITLAFTQPVFAEGNAPIIAVVDIQRVMKDSTAAKDVREQLEKKQKSFQAEITKKEEALQEEDKELGKKRSVLSKEAFEEKASAFRTKATDVQKDVQSKKALLDSAFENSLNDIQKVVTDIIKDLSNEKGFLLAMPSSQILYTDSGLDISSEVLKRLNEKLPKLEVKFEAPAKTKKK
jgi:outer membrane protein